jgi:hypothetical protein
MMPIVKGLILLIYYYPGRWIIERFVLSPRAGRPITIRELGSYGVPGTDGIRRTLDLLAVTLTIALWWVFSSMFVGHTTSPIAVAGLGVAAGSVWYANRLAATLWSKVQVQPASGHLQPGVSVSGSSAAEMRERANIERLVRQARSEDPRARVEAIDGLLSVGTSPALEAAVGVLTVRLQQFDPREKLEAITLMQGRAPRLFLRALMGDTDVMETLTRFNYRHKVPLDMVRSPLTELIDDAQVPPLVSWYAWTALVELGDRDEGLADEHVRRTEVLLGWLGERHPGEDGLADLVRAILEVEVGNLTIRALSHFQGSDMVAEVLVDALYGRRLIGRQKPIVPRPEALYALAALGRPSTLERLTADLERWATYGDDNTKRRVAVATEMYGKASFDSVAAQVKARFGID